MTLSPRTGAFRFSLCIAAMLAVLLVRPVWAQAPAGDAANAPATFTPTPTGVTIETRSYRVRIDAGLITSLFNKLTDEEYLSRHQDVEAFLRRLPTGLATQAGEANFQAAAKLYRWPWNELAEDQSLACYRRPTPKSKFTFKQVDARLGVATWTGLTDGQATFDDESFELALAVDEATGDLLVTPAGKSPRPGVFAAALTLAPTAPLVSVEAPIFDGIRITSDMQANTWLSKWPEYWDWGFIALNGGQVGAFGVWAQDADLRYKDLFYRVRNKGIGVSLSTMNTPPFDKLTEAKGVTWHVQAFDKSWSQAAARFRDWRLKNAKIAPRPEWTRQISFVNSGVNAGKGWLDTLSAYLDGQHLERTATFAPVIRSAAFDTKHWDNSYYPAFPEEMKAWKPTGAKLMAYLQPMIMWSRPDDKDTEALKIVALSGEANTKSVFQKELKPLLYVDQHHLGHAAWQAWFLACVKNFIDAGADGVYHDQSYPCPVDARGPVNGMTSPQGMADYFFKAQTQSPNTIHATEHMQEANSAGTSLGIGSGVLWGTAGGMRYQRIHHPSPVSNALAFPNGTIFAFPHYSDYGTRGEATFFHWGMDQMEGRGDIPGLALQNTGHYSGKGVPYSEWVNEYKLDRLRSQLFVKLGLRPAYPEDWSPEVKTYFKGAGGEDFRYETTPWGSQFVQIIDGKPKFHYGRAHGSTHAAAAGGIAGWTFYNDQGPSGLDPKRYYVIDPEVTRPAAHFAPAWTIVPETPVVDSFYESVIDDTCGSNSFLWMRIKPLPEQGNIISYDKILLKSPKPPVAVFVNGQPTPATPRGEGAFEIAINVPQPANECNVAVLLAEPAPGLDDLKAATLARQVSSVNLDVFASSFVTGKVTQGKAKIPGRPIAPATTAPAAAPAPIEIPTLNSPLGATAGVRATQFHLPIKATAAGSLKLHALTPAAPITAVAVNGVTADKLATIAFKAGETKLISINLAAGATSVGFEWIEPEAPAAKK